MSTKRDVLGRLVSRLIPPLGPLAKAALRGNKDAAAGLLDVASLTTFVLEHIASTNPDVLKPLARPVERWPVLISVHPEDLKSVHSTVKDLELGLDDPLSPKVRKGKGWSKKTPAIAIVRHYVKRLGGARYVHGSLKRQLGEVPRRYSDELTARILALPDLSKATADSWFEVMWSALLSDHKMHPERHPVLGKLGDYRAEHNEATHTTRTREADIRDGIKTKLKAALGRILDMSSPNIAPNKRGR